MVAVFSVGYGRIIAKFELCTIHDVGTGTSGLRRRRREKTVLAPISQEPSLAMSPECFCYQVEDFSSPSYLCLVNWAPDLPSAIQPRPENPQRPAHREGLSSLYQNPWCQDLWNICMDGVRVRFLIIHWYKSSLVIFLFARKENTMRWYTLKWYAIYRRDSLSPATEVSEHHRVPMSRSPKIL